MPSSSLFCQVLLTSLEKALVESFSTTALQLKPQALPALREFVTWARWCLAINEGKGYRD